MVKNSKTPMPSPKSSSVVSKKSLGPARARYNKQEMVIGVVFIILSFLVVFFIFYFVIRDNKEIYGEKVELQEAIEVLNTEHVALQERSDQLEQKVGESLSLKKLLAQAETAYGPEEKNRKAGHLWIDRKSGILYVTLGALHGLTPGDKINVYDGTKAVGMVRVETPMDVIAYVRLINKEIKDFPKDTYQVKIGD